MKECNFVHVNDHNQLEQQTSLKVCSLNDFKQLTIVPINHREKVGDLIEQTVISLKKRTLNLGKNNTTKMSTDTVNHPPNKLQPYRTFPRCQIVDCVSNCRQ